MWSIQPIDLVSGAAVGLGAFWLNRDGDGPVPIAGQLTAEYPTAPSVAWQVSAPELGGESLLALDSSQSQYFAIGLSHDDRSIVTLLRDDDSLSSGSRVLGVDTATGSHWLTDFRVRGCADTIVAGRTACYLEDDGVYVIDVTDGSVLWQAPLPASQAVVSLSMVRSSTCAIRAVGRSLYSARSLETVRAGSSRSHDRASRTR